ncbi:hypothetical protein EAH79_15235 [Sphingomonas koreensis]|nr:hypothetical protein EAH79_15235 [Sphingomonas koreensis]
MTDPSDQPLEVRWDTSTLGCFLPIIALMAAFFLLAAFFPIVVPDGSFSTTRMIALAGPTIGGVRIGFLGMAVIAGGGVYLNGARFIDDVALKATPAGLRFHTSLRQPNVPWSQVVKVAATSTRDIYEIMVDLAGTADDPSPRRIMVKPVDEGRGQVARFCDVAARRIVAARASGANTSVPPRAQ